MKSIILIGFFFTLMLAACGQAMLVPTPTEMHASATSTTLPPPPTAQKTLRSTATTGFYFTPTPTGGFLLPTSTSLPPFRACSPLKDHTWTDLREIVTNPFDPPPPGKDSGHQGVDFAYYRRGNRLSIEGVPVQSVLPGIVAAVIHNRIPYGNMVIVETPSALVPEAVAEFLGMNSGQSVYLLYAHMKTDPLVVLGQQVSCGDELGEVGNTPPGWSSAPHLHLEVRTGPSRQRFASMAYYDNSITLEEKSNYELWRTSGTFRMLDPMSLLGYLYTIGLTQ